MNADNLTTGNDQNTGFHLHITNPKKIVNIANFRTIAKVCSKTKGLKENRIFSQGLILFKTWEMKLWLLLITCM